jgi:two-component system, LytTR family, response regulator
MEPARSLIIPLPSVNTAAVVTDFKVSKKVSWQKLAVHTLDEIRFIPFDEIVYCSAQINYTRIFTRNGKSFLCSKTLKEVEKNLPGERFIRIHHSHLVSLHDITALKKRDGMLEINYETLLPISRNMKKVVADFLCG